MIKVLEHNDFDGLFGPETKVESGDDLKGELLQTYAEYQSDTRTMLWWKIEYLVIVS
jgi:hypothetical protein